VEHTQEEIRFQVAGAPRTAVVRTPKRLNTDPAILLHFGGAWRDMLDHESYRMIPDAFLAAGHRVAAFDMPCHGERANEKFGGDLAGMVATIKAGVNPYFDIRDTAAALIDIFLARKFIRPGGVALHGTSRGGLAAMHVLANNPNAMAAVIHAPLIYLPAVREMADLVGNPVAEACNAFSLVDKLADRPLLVVNGETDPRVDEKQMFAFFAQLTAKSRQRPPEIYIAPGVSHGWTFPTDAGYNAALGFLLSKVANWMKHPLPEPAK